MNAMFALRNIIALTSALIGLTLLTAPPSFAEPADLFADHPSSAQTGVSGQQGVDPTIIRERPVTVNVHSLLSIAEQTAVGLAARPIPLNLFPDVRRDFVPEKSEKSRDGKFTILSGSIAGGKPLMNNATFVFGDGVVIANIRPGWDNKIYQLRVSPSGTPLVQEVDASNFPTEGAPIPVTPPTAPDVAGVAAPSAPTQTAPVPVPDDGTTINVMVVYTASARLAQGGTAAIQALINLGVSETNQGYANSSVTQRITLAHAAEVPYTEGAGGAGFNAALTDVTGTSDGKMDNVHTLRNTYAADMVSLWINNATYCGLAYLMTTASPAFASNAFSVVHYTCATGYYSFAHEMGHNQGSHHDTYVAPENGVYSYSHGYVDTLNQFRTVMAYGDACGNCSRINYWSNPSVNYTARTTGAADANNTLSLNNTVSVAANWRSSSSLLGSLNVTITPSGAVTDGARWSVDGGAWQISGATVSDLSVGNHTVSFNTLAGWATPADQIVSIVSGQTTSATGAYTPTYTVTATAGAGGLVAPTSQDVASGSTASVTVTPDAGYTADTTVGGTCAVGSWAETTYTTGTVTADCSMTFSFIPPGSLTVNILPAEAVTAGARWRVDSGAWQISGATVSNLTVGNHHIAFNALTGWASPDNQVVNIASGQTTTTTGTYMPVFTVTATAGAGGSVDPTSQDVASGSTASFTVTPNAGYTASVGGTCVAGSWAGDTYTTGAVTADCSVDFTFIPPGSLTVSILPGSGYVASRARWKVDGGAWRTTGATVATLTVGSHTLSFKSVTGWTTPTDQTVSIVAGQTTTATGTYTLTVTPLAGTGGSISPSTPQEVNYGSTTSFTATPEDGVFPMPGVTNYAANIRVGGTCAVGSWVGAIYTTGTVTSACTVIFSFAPPGFHAVERDFTVTITPDQAISDGAKWSLDGGLVWHESGHTVVGPRKYTITFKDTTTGGWRTPHSVSSTATAPVSLTRPYPHVANDYDNNGKSDVLFRNETTGHLYEWKMNGATVTDGGYFDTNPGVASSPGAIVAQADFNGDGKTDLLFEDSSADPKVLTMWMMNADRTVSTSSVVTIASPARTTTEIFAGAADFDGDGNADILLVDTAPGGVTTAPLTPRILFMEGSSVDSQSNTKLSNGTTNLTIPQTASTAYALNTHSGWRVAALADFNNDGMMDILWRSGNTGQARIWIMNGARRISNASLPASLGAYRNTTGGATPSGWLVAGTGDFNGDGYTDIILRNSSTGGEVAVWLLKGLTGSTVGKIANGRNAALVALRGSGALVDADGTVINTGAFTAVSGWSVIGVGDFSGEGMDDLLWRYLGSGHTYVMALNGRTIMDTSGFTSVYPGSVLTWQAQIMRTVVDPQ
ncbi:MAG: FG-GAP repeat protein [Nitrospinae bacterium]|nr:FG-GAP repeat protein [Nitrospinota bacterium]